MSFSKSIQLTVMCFGIYLSGNASDSTPALKNRIRPNQLSINVGIPHIALSYERNLRHYQSLYFSVGMSTAMIRNPRMTDAGYFESPAGADMGTDRPWFPATPFVAFFAVEYRYYFVPFRLQQEYHSVYSNSGIYAGAEARFQSSALFAGKEHREKVILETYKAGVFLGLQNEFGPGKRYIIDFQIGFGKLYNRDLSWSEFTPIGKIRVGVRIGR